jgi:hypothetical protein
MAELTSSPLLARSVDRDLASAQDGPHVTTRVDQAGELHQLAQADHGSADLHNGLDRMAGWIGDHHQTVSWIAPQPAPATGRPMPWRCPALAHSHRPHDVRHSYATAGRDAKIDWKVLSVRLGHADVAFTMKQYVQAGLEADRQVAHALPELIVGGEILLRPRTGRTRLPVIRSTAPRLVTCGRHATPAIVRRRRR